MSFSKNENGRHSLSMFEICLLAAINSQQALVQLNIQILDLTYAT